MASRNTIKELIRVLVDPKFKLTDGYREDLFGDYLPWCETTSVAFKERFDDNTNNKIKGG